MSAFASWSFAALTISGRRPVEAGWKNDDATPKTAEDTARCQTSIASVTNATAITAWTTARTASAPIISARRGSRSAQTPPMTTESMRAPMCAPRTMPRSLAVPSSSTANESATGTIESPMLESERPSQSRRNSRSPSSPILPRTVTRGSLSR
jgi:hypothetical protein